MLSENIKTIRKSKGLSQEELATRLNVVRQTVSKWERGLSVPDADMLIALSEAFEMPVHVLLGESVEMPEADDLKAMAAKLEVINLQLAQEKGRRRRLLKFVLMGVCAATLLVGVCLAAMDSSYLSWDYSDPEIAVVGTIYHAFEWVFFRVAPLLIVGSLAGVCLLARRRP